MHIVAVEVNSPHADSKNLCYFRQSLILVVPPIDILELSRRQMQFNFYVPLPADQRMDIFKFTGGTAQTPAAVCCNVIAVPATNGLATTPVSHVACPLVNVRVCVVVPLLKESTSGVAQVTDPAVFVA